MKVFISWSGGLSRALAAELHEWLPMVVQQVEPWISARDIGPGERWELALRHQLAQSDFAIICLTADNLQSPWILFEAGAVARSLEARVVPLLLGITPRDLDGPLAQFQSLQADEAGIRKLVSVLYDSSQSGLETYKQDKVFGQLWPLLDGRLRSLAAQAGPTSEVVSPVDLVRDFAVSPSAPPATAAAEKQVFERIEEERQRLLRELEYLKAEEDKLTQQNAPFSLFERAIEPTEHRLAKVETTLEAALDQMFEKLQPSQLALLRELVTPRGIRLVRRLKDHSPGRGSSDFDALSQLGLVVADEHGATLAHDLIAEYIGRKYGAA